MEEYRVRKACWLGDVKTRVKLNHRQAVNCLAGGFIEPVIKMEPVKKDKQEVKK